MSLSWRSCFSSGPVAGLLGPAAALREAIFFRRASSLLVLCGCRVFLVVVQLVLFKACHWLAWSACCFS